MFQEIWPTCDQFLNMMTGSEYEHALLLTNFFASIGKKSFLVLGQVGKKLIWTEVLFFILALPSKTRKLSLLILASN